MMMVGESFWLKATLISLFYLYLFGLYIWLDYVWDGHFLLLDYLCALPIHMVVVCVWDFVCSFEHCMVMKLRIYLVCIVCNLMMGHLHYWTTILYYTRNYRCINCGMKRAQVCLFSTDGIIYELSIIAIIFLVLLLF